MINKIGPKMNPWGTPKNLFSKSLNADSKVKNVRFLVNFADVLNTAQKMKFSIKDFFCKCGFGHIYFRNP